MGNLAQPNTGRGNSVRTRTVSVCLFVLAITLISACAGKAPAPTQTAPPTDTPAPLERSATDQVAAGQQVYETQCSRCHGAGLVDGFAAKLSAAALARYGTAQKLFDYLYGAMPKGSPGSLSEQEYFDVSAYMLSRQGLLGSEQILGPDTAGSIQLAD